MIKTPNLFLHDMKGHRLVKAVEQGVNWADLKFRADPYL